MRTRDGRLSGRGRAVLLGVVLLSGWLIWEEYADGDLWGALLRSLGPALCLFLLFTPRSAKPRLSLLGYASVGLLALVGAALEGRLGFDAYSALFRNGPFDWDLLFWTPIVVGVIWLMGSSMLDFAAEEREIEES